MARRQEGVVISAEGRAPEGWDDPARGTASWVTLFSADRTATDSMCAGIMDIPANGGCLKPHRHAQAELYFVVAGSGVLTIGGFEHAIAAGSAAFIPGDAEHAVRNENSEPLKIFYVFPTDRFAEIIYRFPDAC